MIKSIGDFYSQNNKQEDSMDIFAMLNFVIFYMRHKKD